MKIKTRKELEKKIRKNYDGVNAKLTISLTQVSTNWR